MSSVQQSLCLRRFRTPESDAVPRQDWQHLVAVQRHRRTRRTSAAAAETLRPHHRCAHQSSLAPRAGARITFKVATLTYRALHGFAPPYLAASFTRVAGMPHRRRLRSASTEQLDVPTCRLSTIGARAFPGAGAKVWNGLPSDVT